MYVMNWIFLCFPFVYHRTSEKLMFVQHGTFLLNEHLLKGIYLKSIEYNKKNSPFFRVFVGWTVPRGIFQSEKSGYATSKYQELRIERFLGLIIKCQQMALLLRTFSFSTPMDPHTTELLSNKFRPIFLFVCSTNFAIKFSVVRDAFSYFSSLF